MTTFAKKFYIYEIITIFFVVFSVVQFVQADEFTAPYIYEVTPVQTPSDGQSLYYEFYSDEDGYIEYFGSCSSNTSSAYGGVNGIYFNPSFPDGYYDDCTITVYDVYNNQSNTLYVSAFVIDTTAPTLYEVTPVQTPSDGQNLEYRFYSDEDGYITYYGSCLSSYTDAYEGENYTAFNILPVGTYDDCGVSVTDEVGNESQILSISEFIVTDPPVLAETYAIYSPNPDTTPWYQFESNEAGTITYGGSCSSLTTNAVAGENTIIFNELAEGYYDDCTVTVTDGDLGVSEPLVVSPFTIEETAPYFYFLNVSIISETSVTVTPYTAVPGTEVGIEYGLTESYGQILNDQRDFIVGGTPLSLTGLNSNNTLYYYRPYVITDEGTFYGNPGTFRTNVLPQISQISGIVSPNPDVTPVYRFTTTEAGTITYGGSCSSLTTNAVAGENTIIFNELANGTYSNCTIVVTDQNGASSNVLTLPSFTINAATPIFSSVMSYFISQTSTQIDVTTVVPGTEVGVQYGITQSFGQTQNQQGSFVVGNVSLSLVGLIPNIVYYYRPYITTDEGILYGAIGTFTTVQPEISEGWTAQTNSGLRAWWDLAISSNGQKIAATVAQDGEYIYTSLDGGNTWIQRTSAGSRQWRRIASSPDGVILVAAAQGDYIYRSTDSGATWTALTSAGTGNWWSVAMSPDGTKIVAAQWGWGLSTSTDGGATWTQRPGAGERYWYSLDISSDGTKIVGVGWQNGRIVTSWNSGATWTVRTAAGARNWITVDMSPDGTKIAAVAENANPYTSSDSGATWTERTGGGSRLWGGISSSDDGTILFAAARGGYIYKSNDSGATWVQQTSAGSRSWLFIDSNNNGEIAAVSVQGGNIHTYSQESFYPTTTITEISAVASPGTDTTPTYSFTTTKAGTITYGGSCTSATTAAILGVNTITFNELALGTYADCTITVDNSNTVTLGAFIISAPVSTDRLIGFVGGSLLPIVPPIIKQIIENLSQPIYNELQKKESSTKKIKENIFLERLPVEETSQPEQDSNSFSKDPQTTNLSRQPVNTIALLGSTVIAFLNSALQTLSSFERITPAVFEAIKTSAIAIGILLVVTSIITSASGFTPLLDIPRLLAHLWNVLLTALGLRKKRKPWGTVYDSQTKQPLDPAYVTLTDMTGKEVASSLTDIDGRYGFVVPPGTYTLSAKKTNYAFPSKKLQGAFEDELYTSLYFGEQVTITEEGEIINKNIPLDQLAFDWNEFAKIEQHRLTYFRKRDVIFGKISQVLFIGGFLFSLIALFATPTFFQILVTLVYVIIFFVRRYDPKLKATGFISKTDGTPLPFAIIRLLSITTGQEIAHKVADKVGRYYAIVPNGTYNITIDEKTPDGSYTKHALTRAVTISKGFLGESVRV